ncbi:FAD-binding oxidoreductase [Streptomyces sp. ISL-11]|uniref:FAD-binding oxidoreductase n=1 Tax=Streptomyces sp. ISL-11 TaxID=2819174 RepID=UPI001BE70A6F|nr:FAD-binding protein [Streptomyces sp. ISL-11]MBT2383997.1 FAD-binding oxidoreductase [Streptomyces sp. ISL-11]
MEQESRRAFLAEHAADGGAAADGRTPPAEADTAASGGAITVTPGDSRYADLTRGYNLRWVFRPEAIRMADSRRQVEDAVREAFRAGKRIAVRSGGHCYEGFGTDAKVVIDLSSMNSVTFDASRGAFAIEPGATLGEVYEALYETWGVVLPGGACPSVGIGGHIAGGGHGPLSRLHGITTDYLHAVEVVTVNAAGRVTTVVATREDYEHGRPKGALWWAHTGGGGGNFGVVTRYWFRTPGGKGDDPRRLLPKPPGEVFVSTVTWSWEGMTEAAFTRLAKNYSSWCERHAAGSAYDSLYSQFQPTPRAAGSFSMITQFDATGPDAERLLDAYFAEINEGTGLTPRVEKRRLPWLHATQWPGLAGPNTPTFRFKAKSAYQRRTLPDRQIRAMYKYLTEVEYPNPAARLLMIAFGGKTNTRAREATAFPHRDAVMEMHYVTAWYEDAEEPVHLQWIRDFYAAVYADTGGVPVTNAETDGCYFNYPDVDLDDPEFNRSGVSAHRLYYGENYEALIEAKRAFDPHDVFQHTQSLPAK